MLHAIRCLVSLIVLSGSLLAQLNNLSDFYVNGLTGANTPTNGTSATTPWKTITYALTQIPPVSQVLDIYTLYVEGNQVYSSSTNNKSMPIKPVYNVWMEGTFAGHGNQPIIRASTEGTSMAFQPNVVYNHRGGFKNALNLPVCPCTFSSVVASSARWRDG